MPVKQVSPSEAAKLISTGSVRVVDCREEDEFAICRLPGAELMPLSRFGFDAAERLPDKSQPILIYCHHGMRSMTASEYLVRRGYENVSNLTGGIDAYATDVDPSITRY